MIDWNIQSRSHACQACHTHFRDKEGFHTILFDQRSGYERLDLCESCWKNRDADATKTQKNFISHWQSIYTPPPAAPPDPIQKETAETLLRKLLEQNSPEHAAARFILAVMLERKRLLKVKAQLQEDGHRVFVYEHPKSGDLFNIADPNLQLDQLEEVQRDVAHLLEHGLAPAQAVSAPPEPLPVAAPDVPAQAEPQPESSAN